MGVRVAEDTRKRAAQALPALATRICRFYVAFSIVSRLSLFARPTAEAAPPPPQSLAPSSDPAYLNTGGAGTGVLQNAAAYGGAYAGGLGMGQEVRLGAGGALAPMHCLAWLAGTIRSPAVRDCRLLLSLPAGMAHGSLLRPGECSLSPACHDKAALALPPLPFYERPMDLPMPHMPGISISTAIHPPAPPQSSYASLYASQLDPYHSLRARDMAASMMGWDAYSMGMYYSGEQKTMGVTVGSVLRAVYVHLCACVCVPRAMRCTATAQYDPDHCDPVLLLP